MWLSLGNQSRELRDGELVVGSGADADWRVTTADLKPRHFTITTYDLNASLKPATKESVVVVNGTQVVDVARLLNDGDAIAAGSGLFVFTDGQPDPNAEAPSARVVDDAFLLEVATNVAHALRSRSVGLGRDTSNAVVVSDPRASRFHAEVRREAGGYALHSMGAAGTLVNGKSVDGPCLLRDGDVIDIASLEFRYGQELPDGAGFAAMDERPRRDVRRQPTELRGRAVSQTGRVGENPRAPATRRAWLVAIVAAIVVLAVVVAHLARA